jgi:hypothetical protein
VIGDRLEGALVEPDGLARLAGLAVPDGTRQGQLARDGLGVLVQDGALLVQRGQLVQLPRGSPDAGQAVERG